MRPDDLRNVGDAERLLALIRFHFQLLRTQVLLLTSSYVNCGQHRYHGIYLLSGAIGMVQVDSDLTLTGTECVHREYSRTHDPVPTGLDALKRAEMQLSDLIQSSQSVRFSS